MVVWLPSGAHQFCQFVAPHAEGETEWCLAIISLPVRISPMREKPDHNFGSYCGIPQQHAPMKKRTAIGLARKIDINAAL